MIAEHMDGIERHQRVHGRPRIEGTAGHVAKIDDLADPARTDVGQHGFQCEIVSVHVGDRCKTHVHSTYPEGCFPSKNKGKRLPHLGETAAQHAPRIFCVSRVPCRRA